MSPCQAKDAGETIRQLATGYVENTSCIFKYEASFNAIRDWKKAKEKLYNGSTNGK